jgi:hypothetical protein
MEERVEPAPQPSMTDQPQRNNSNINGIQTSPQVRYNCHWSGSSCANNCELSLGLGLGLAFIFVCVCVVVVLALWFNTQRIA